MKCLNIACKSFILVAQFILAGATGAAAIPQLTESLAAPVEYVRFENESIASALQVLARGQGVAILCDRDVEGQVSLEMSGAPLQTVLEAILCSGGHSYELGQNWIQVRRHQTKNYILDYPQVMRTGSASSTISMGGSSHREGGESGLQLNALPLSPAVGHRAEGGGYNGSQGSDATQIQIQQKSDGDLWTTLEAQLRSMLRADESLVLNRFSGVVQLKAGSATHREVSDFIQLINHRIGAQVEIVAKIVEVRLSRQRKLGIDWSVAAFSIGKHLEVGAGVIPPGEATALSGLTGPTNVRQAGEFQFSPETFTGTISSGKVDVVLRALEEQGDVSVTSQPRLRLLNNQTGFIKDATDRPFFRMVSNVTINAGGLPAAGAQPITQTQYQTQTISIGTVLPVTAQISADDEVTLDVTPALTRLREVVTSPDRLQTAPVLEVKQTSTVVRLRSGESAILGGLITDSDATTQRSVPVLGALPGVGRLFRSDGKSHSRSELVIILTPQVIKPQSKGLSSAP